MALTDEVTLRIRAGAGGDGVVRFRHEKYNEFAGPSGGDGGEGGSVRVVGVRDLSALGRLSGKNEISAEKGEDGRGSSQTGKRGVDATVEVPVGTRITSEAGETWEILSEGEEVVLARGGTGGFGNEHFKSATNQAPQEALPGRPGEEHTVTFSLQLIADLGLIGLPNAGKTSLLNALTRAQGKVGNYAFTTLEPALGVYHGLTIADIPGLIEGASEGRGLGLKFLKHISRTRALLYCISVERENILDDYHTVRGELSRFDEKMLEKEEIIILTKVDDLSSTDIAERVSALSTEVGCEVYPVSILDDASLKKLGDVLTHRFSREGDA
ncbi:GTPase ObgE [Patescibacteria group bacterium]|jgi:GTP-binding protein|nr:GTPase ObgE [Patescibacteria group bacterium]